MTEVRIQPSFDAWRDAARHLLMQHRPPGRVLWVEDGAAQGVLPGLSSPAEAGLPHGDLGIPRVAKRAGVRVPKQFVDLARDVACHCEPERWALLYRALWRIATTEPGLLADEADPDVRRLGLLRQQVRRDVHKMHAFVRFRKIEGPGNGGAVPEATPWSPRNSQLPTPNSPRDAFVAWYEPDHRIVRLAAPFFAERFATLDWAILTPHECAWWDGHELRFGPGVPKSQAPRGDDLEALWCTYYASIFNPARVKLGAMKKEMPRRFWKNLPEAQQIDALLEQAPDRVDEMMARSAAAARADAYPTAGAFIPKVDRLTLPLLAEASKACRGCAICELGTRPVFGEGPENARAVFVGEQPGDNEDLQGRPFVGPAGQLLDEALARVGIDRGRLYVTNAVKHFKFEQNTSEAPGSRGPRRIHAKPSAREIQACKPWLVAEVDVIKPAMIVALGATAAQSMLGPTFRITQMRGKVFTDTEWAPWWMATLHPSALLRIPDPKLREQAHRHFVEDLALAAQKLNSLG